MGRIKNQLISGIWWVAVSRYSALGIQFIVTIIIARILSPSDYGIIGLLTVFTAISNIIVESGFGQALIQKGNADNKDFSSVFFLNLLISVFLYLLLFLSSKYIAIFYNIKVLEHLAKLLFLIIPINSVGLIHDIMLQRDMKFKKLAFVSVIAVIVSGLFGIIFAYKGFGTLALVYQLLIQNTVKTIILIIQNNWKPTFVFSISSIQELYPLSINLLGTGFIIVLFNNIYTILIGRFYNSNDVGFYNQAKRFAEMASLTITNIIFTVSFPALVKFKSDIEKLREGYKKIIDLTIFIVSPIMFLLIAISKNLFIVVLTEKWLPSVPYFNLLCIYGLTFPLHQINTNILKVLGKGRMIFKIEVFRRVLLVISILFTIKKGVSYLLIGQIITTLIIMFVNMYFSGKEVNLSLLKQIKHTLPYYSIGIVSFVVVYFFSDIFLSRFLTLMFQSFLFLIIYYFLNKIFMTNSYNEFQGIVKNIKFNKKHQKA